jgi:hypothetical protein
LCWGRFAPATQLHCMTTDKFKKEKTNQWEQATSHHHANRGSAPKLNRLNPKSRR